MEMECSDDESYRSPADHAMSIELIAEKIFEELCSCDLKTCSLVSKTWNFHARNVSRIEAVVTESNSCSQLLELNRLLETSFNVPFDGVSIEGPCSEDGTCVDCCLDKTEFTSNILSRMDMNSMTVYLFKDSTSCPTVDAIKKILLETCSGLLRLNIFMFPSTISSIKNYIGLSDESPKNWLGNLTYLSIPSFEDCDRLAASCFTEFITAAPNLHVLDGTVIPDYLKILLEYNKASIVTDFVFDPNIEEHLDACFKFAKEGPQLKKLKIKTVTEIVENFLPNELVEIMKLLLSSSCNTLKELRIDHFNLYLYSRLGIPILKELRKLSIPYEDIGQGIVNLRRVDFGHFFPSLHTVEIRYDDLSNIDVQIPGDFQRLVCNTVTSFKLNVGNRELNLNPVDNFSKIFPNVQDFYCSGCLDLRAVCIFLWVAWADLESITFTDLASHHIPNLDWMFCGIFEAEAIRLLKLDPESLVNHTLVPCFPSVLNCTKLKKFRVEIKHFGRDCEQNRFFPSFLSHTTGQLAFARMPDLVVEINYKTYCSHSGCEYSLDHLLPFAKFGEFHDAEDLVYDM